jgi:hypothetical protein
MNLLYRQFSYSFAVFMQLRWILSTHVFGIRGVSVTKIYQSNVIHHAVREGILSAMGVLEVK